MPLPLQSAPQTSYNAFGAQVTLVDWFAFGFTVAELKTLRKRQRFDFRDQSFNGLFIIPTLAEHIAVAQSASHPVAIYPELKHPALVNSVFLQNSSPRFEDIVLEVLEKYRTVSYTLKAYFAWL